LQTFIPNRYFQNTSKVAAKLQIDHAKFIETKSFSSSN
jgi:hypothetical protein